MARKDARRSQVPAEVTQQQLGEEKHEGGAEQQQASREKGGPSCRFADRCQPSRRCCWPMTSLPNPSPALPTHAKYQSLTVSGLAHPATFLQPEHGLRRRRQPRPAAAAGTAAESEPAFVDPTESMPWYSYYPR